VSIIRKKNLKKCKMMGNISNLISPYFNNDNINETNHNKKMISSERPSFNPGNFSLTAEGGKNFSHYLKRFDLFKEPEILILSPNRLFYYDENDLINVRTFVILKKLNLIKDLDTVLCTINRILPANVNFIGCFSDSKPFKWNGFLSDLSTRFTNILDSRTDHILDKKDVSELLEKCGFRIVDITEMNGLTFFYSQNIRKPIEIKA
jgi:hypothetical protein